MKVFTSGMPLRYGEYKPLGSEAHRLAGGVGYHDNQPYIPHTRPRIEYPKSPNRPTKIPLGFDPSEIMAGEAHERGLKRGGCWPVCHHGRQACPTKPQPLDVPPPNPPIPEPENTWEDGARETTRWSFDNRPEWVKHQPLEDEAKARYSKFIVDASSQRGIKPGQFWAEADLKAMKRRLDAARSKAKDITEMPDLDDPDRYEIPTQQYPGRICANCLDTYELEPHQGTKTRYCSQRCRKYADNARNRGMSGTVNARDLPVDDWEIVGTTYGYEGMWAVA